jgi:hypothetical protein
MSGGRGVAIVVAVAVLVAGARPAASGVEAHAGGGGGGERQAILDAHEAAIEARRASLYPPNPHHPAIEQTMTAAARTGWAGWVEMARDHPSDAFVFEPPVEHQPLAVATEEIDGAQLAFVVDCQLEQGERLVGTSAEPEPDPDPAHRTVDLGADVMAKVGGRWKLALFMQVTPSETGQLGCTAD